MAPARHGSAAVGAANAVLPPRGQAPAPAHHYNDSACPAHAQDLDLSDSDCLDVRPLRAATGLTRLALSGFALPPQHEVHRSVSLG